MKKSLIKQCLSLLIVLFFLFNFLSLSLFNGKDSVYVKNSSLEQILSVLQNPTDMLSNMMDNNSATKTDNTKKDVEEKSNFLEYILPTDTINISSPSNNFVYLLIKNIANNFYNCLSLEFDYPIKIPFLGCIFLLLLLKLIFSILKRSISINYNKINIERACIVY
ncbi:MAG: hypothetical protein J6U02_00915 [Elusimicrobia bacterium]|nr:hypothetical protein [Elusimicrobiota bacterium]